MTYESERLGHSGRGPGWSLWGLARKLLAFVVAALLLAGAIAISIVAFVFIVAGMIVAGLYLWWKSRDMRRQMPRPGGQGTLIEGEVVERSVRDLDPHDR